MAYDTRRERLVLAGGSAGLNVFQDTWELDGTAWHNIPIVHSAGNLEAMAYDPVVGKCVACNAYLMMPFPVGWTWTHDGRDWTEEPTAPAPSPRIAPNMV